MFRPFSSVGHQKIVLTPFAGEVTCQTCLKQIERSREFNDRLCKGIPDKNITVHYVLMPYGSSSLCCTSVKNLSAMPSMVTCRTCLKILKTQMEGSLSSHFDYFWTQETDWWKEEILYALKIVNEKLEESNEK